VIGIIRAKRLYRPEALALLASDALGRRGPRHDTQRHLAEAAGWILRAQAATADDGVSGGYSFEDGWIASYPETTGYIIPTLLVYAERSKRPDCRERALAMAEWERSVQLPEGGFPAHFVDRRHPPAVFNTGQVIFGLLAAWQATGDSHYLEAAQRAGAWLARVQDDDGAWRRYDYRDAVHVYQTRTAWALCELGLRTGEAAIQKAGERALDWALTLQEPNAWFRHAAFGPGEDPYLHTIAYTTQGLLEAGLRLGRTDWIDAATRTCRAVLGAMRPDGFLPGTFGPRWRPTARYSCLTGNAQMAAQWLRLHAATGDAAFFDGGRRAIDFLKALHDCSTPNLNVRGGIKGSHPIWGRYLFGTYPNWAAKFFMDALLMDDAVAAGETSCIPCW
jgi:hypothetical protein